MTIPTAIVVSGLSHNYGSNRAVKDISLEIATGEVFAFVGPNGSGKTTLFRVLSTLVPIQRGEVRMLGCDLRTQAEMIRRDIGVVFQAPSLDKKLTVEENLRYHGHLYGLTSRQLAAREDELLSRLGLAARRHDLVEKLSGGLRRRVELAKSMLHRPRLLLLDEPSTGLDPAARNDLWQHLQMLRSEDGVTIVLTTHLLDEAEKASRVAILNEGQLVAIDAPDTLRASVGGDAITIRADDCERLAGDIRGTFECDVEIIDGAIRLEQADGHRWIARLVEAFPGRIDAITYSRPTLEDVFIDHTGHRFRQEPEEAIA